MERFRAYLRDVRSEMRKVAWSSRQQLINSTRVVLLVVAIVTAYIFVADQAVGVFVRQVLFSR